MFWIWLVIAALAGSILGALGVVLLSPQKLVALEILEKSPFAEFKRQPDSIPQAILRVPWALAFMLLSFSLRILYIAVAIFTAVFWPFGGSVTLFGGLVWLLAGMSGANLPGADLPGKAIALCVVVFSAAYLYSYREGWVLYGGDLTERKSLRQNLTGKAESDE